MKRELGWIIVVLVAIAIVFCSGCQEEQKSKIWGEGELPVKWREFFGGDNMSRLNFTQTKASNRHEALIFGVTIRDPNGQSVRKRGLVERVTALEGHVDVLERINSEQHKKIGETQKRFHKRIEALEGREPNTISFDAALMRGTLYRLNALEEQIKALEEVEAAVAHYKNLTPDASPDIKFVKDPNWMNVGETK